MNRSDIKVKAYAVFRRGNAILVNNVYEDGVLKGFRIPGGHVEFGEHAIDAVQREIMEELGQEAENYRLLSVIENIFVYNGKAGHEVIFAYLADFKDRSLYQCEEIAAFEHTDGEHFTLFWQELDACPPGTRIFPDGLVDLLKAV